MATACPTDLGRHKLGGRPAIHDRRELVNAMAYWLQAGCAWQLLPNDLPPWQNRARIWCAAITVTEPIGAALVRLALRKFVK